jgi:DNA-binding IclR family transcriptional regulator
MTSARLADSVQALLRDRVMTFEQLEILLLLQTHPHDDWTAAAAAERSRIPADLVGRALADFSDSGLVEQVRENPAAYCFAPRTTQLRQAVADLAAAYRERRALVMSTMSVNAIERIRSATLRAFSDAFLLRKKDDDG